MSRIENIILEINRFNGQQSVDNYLASKKHSFIPNAIIDIFVTDESQSKITVRYLVDKITIPEIVTYLNDQHLEITAP